ncbi:MAG: hypothetical protein HKO10_11490 [Acidimicrobiia bacterium]|nr:hypothetical protein [Acidimicrobiia bacterium]
MGEHSDEHAEELEFIPWSQLVDSHASRAPRLIYVAAAAVLALGVGAWLAPRVLGNNIEVTPLPAADTPASTSRAALQPAQPEPADRPVVAGDDGSLDGISGLGEGSAFEALAVAEIFVHDYFTRDLDVNRETDLAVWGVVDARADDARADASEYVEWARAYAAEPHDDGWSVEVAFRVITSSGGTFVRQPIRFVTQNVGVDGQPVALPVATKHALVGGINARELVEVPAAIAVEALEAISFWGEQGEPVGGYETEHGWDVVVELSTKARVVVPIS